MLIRWQKTIVDKRGNVQPGAILNIRRESNQALARIYRDRDGLRPYPTGTVTADEYGYAYFYAAPDLYRISSAQPAIDWRDENVGFQDLQQASVTYLTKADMLADTSQPVPTLASVVKDSVEENNAFYVWDGSDWALSSLNPATIPDIQAIAVEAVAEATAEAEGYRDQSEVSAQSASQFADQARAAAEASGERELFDTYAEADAAVASIPEGKAVEVLTDEQNAGAHTLYRVESGALVFKLNLDYLEEQLADGVTPGRGASMVYFSQPGGPARSAADRFREKISVLDYITTPVDGVTSNQAGIENAISAAIARGARLLWPDGIYVSTASIPGFHSIQHIGDGRIKRGEAVFYITPQGAGQRNTIFYSVLGNNNNDGITDDAPRKTLSDFVNVLNRWASCGRMMDGRWRFQFGPGEWLNESIRIDTAPASRYPIEIFGTPDVDTDATPLTRITHTVGGGQRICMWFEPGGYYEVRNWYFKGEGGVGDSSYGYLHKGAGESAVYDCRAEGKHIGFASIGRNSAAFSRCWAISCGDGFRGHYSSAVTIGNSSENACRALSCGQGAYISRASTAHVDYFNPEDCTTAGLLVDMNSRAACIGGNFKRCAIGVLTNGNAEFTDGGINFNGGTADACTITMRNTGAGGELRMYQQTSQLERRIAAGLGPWSVSGSFATLTNVLDFNGTRVRIPAYFFADSLKTIRLRVWGTRTGTAGNKRLRLSVLNYGDLSDVQHLFAVNIGSPEGNWEVEATITATSATTQEIETFNESNAGQAFNHLSAAVTFTADRMLRLYGSTDDPGDTITVNRYEVTLLG